MFTPTQCSVKVAGVVFSHLSVFTPPLDVENLRLDMWRSSFQSYLLMFSFRVVFYLPAVTLQ